MSDIMTQDHPEWNEFIERLSGQEGCDFKEDKNGKVTWTCKGGTDKTKATEILTSMDISIPESLEYFEANGGFCDCEIIMNIGWQ